jgi:hypothetical protein
MKCQICDAPIAGNYIYHILSVNMFACQACSEKPKEELIEWLAKNKKTPSIALEDVKTYKANDLNNLLED